MELYKKDCECLSLQNHTFHCMRSIPFRIEQDDGICFNYDVSCEEISAFLDLMGSDFLSFYLPALDDTSLITERHTLNMLLDLDQKRQVVKVIRECAASSCIRLNGSIVFRFYAVFQIPIPRKNLVAEKVKDFCKIMIEAIRHVIHQTFDPKQEQMQWIVSYATTIMTNPKNLKVVEEGYMLNIKMNFYNILVNENQALLIRRIIMDTFGSVPMFMIGDVKFSTRLPSFWAVDQYRKDVGLIKAVATKHFRKIGDEAFAPSSEYLLLMKSDDAILDIKHLSIYPTWDQIHKIGSLTQTYQSKTMEHDIEHIKNVCTNIWSGINGFAYSDDEIYTVKEKIATIMRCNPLCIQLLQSSGSNLTMNMIQKHYKCPIGRSHDKQPMDLTCTKNGYITLTCRNLQCYGESIIVCKLNSHKSETPRKILDYQSISSNLLYDKLNQQPVLSQTWDDEITIHRYNDLYVRPIGLPDVVNMKMLVAIKSAKGTGKTSMVSKYLKKQNPKSMLAISTRKAVAEKFKKDFDVECYLADNRVKQCSEISEIKHLVISVQSLWKIFDIHQNNHIIYPKYQIIVLDEVDSIFSSFASADTFNCASRSTTYTYLSWILYHAKQIIVCDAGLTQLHLDWIKKLIDHAREYYGLCNINTRIHLFLNERNNDECIYHIQHHSEMMNMFLEVLIDKPQIPIAIFSTTLSNANAALNYCVRLKEHLKDKIVNDLGSDDNPRLPKIVMITGKTSSDDTVKKILSDVDHYLSDCEVFIANSAISTAIDIQSERFENCFCIIDRFGCDITELDQLKDRIRHKKRCYMGIIDNIPDDQVSIADQENRISDIRNKYKDVFNSSDIRTRYAQCNVKGLGNVFLHQQLECSDQWLRSVEQFYNQRRQLSDNNILAFIIYKLSQSRCSIVLGNTSDIRDGVEYKHLQSEARIELKTFDKKRKRALIDKKMSDMVNAPDLTVDQYRLLNGPSCLQPLTSIQLNSIEKFKAEQMFQKKMTLDNAEEMLNPLKRRRLESRKYFQDHQKAIQKDVGSAINNELHTTTTYMIRTITATKVFNIFNLVVDDNNSIVFKDDIVGIQYQNMIKNISHELDLAFPEVCKKKQHGWIYNSTKNIDVIKTLSQVCIAVGFKLDYSRKRIDGVKCRYYRIVSK